MRKMIVFAALLALCMGTAACGSCDKTEDTETAASAPVTLKVVTCYGLDDGNHKNFEEAVDMFEKGTGTIVANSSSLSNEDWKSKVLTDFITGSEPDVLYYFTNADADPFVNAGKVVSIEEIRSEYPDYALNMKEQMMEVAEDGKHYAVPSLGYWESMFVNRSVLEACGIPVPGPEYTWEQFLSDCETIKQAGFTPIACSLYEIPHYWFEFMVMNNGTIDDQLEVPELDADGKLVDNDVSRKWIAALDDIKTLYDLGYFPSNTLTATDTETVGMFADGEAAFLVDGSWKVGYLTQNYPENLEDFVVAYVPGKGGRRASDVIGGISMGYFITRKAWEDPDKQEAAVNFVFYMTSEEVLSTFVTTEATALIDGTSPSGLNVIQQSAADAGKNITGISQAVQDKLRSSVRSELFSNIPKVVTGQMSSAEAIESAMQMD